MAWPRPAWFADLPSGPAYQLNHPLAPETTIKVGGPAQVWAPVADWEQLGALRAFATAQRVPLALLGKGSNMVVPDEGVAGLVVPLGKGCDAVRAEGQTIYAEAGAAAGTAARAARDAGLTGLEFFGGIPGSIGGALKMNAGAYGTETFDSLTEVHVLDEQGQLVIEDPASLQPRYRGTVLPKGWLFKAGRWQLQPGDKEAIRQRMREINHARSTTQPLALPSSGSWFRNVEVTAENLRNLQTIWPEAVVGGKVNAWRIVNAAGARGLQEGGAQVSEQHCNFFVNLGGATAADLQRLSERVEAMVREKFGIVLHREVRYGP